MKKLKVLIVDDSSVMRKIVERALRQAGLDIGEVVEAANGAEALAEVQKGSLDLILGRNRYPCHGRPESLKSVAGVEARSWSVVMITTEGSEARVVRTSSPPHQGPFLRKPLAPEQVKERVTPLLAAAALKLIAKYGANPTAAGSATL